MKETSVHRVAVAGLVLVAASATLAAIVALTTATGDYQPHGAVAGDNAAPAMAALVTGNLARLARVQPLMGLTSLVWRLPFAACANMIDGGAQAMYRLGAFACVLPVAGVVAWIVRRAAGAGMAVSALAVVTILIGPAIRQAVALGHPEEVLAAALATGAVLAAMADRRQAAGLLLGLAIGTKQWALLATPCVLLASPYGRARMVATAALVATAACAILPLADPSGFAHASAGVGAITFVDFPSLWWPLSHPQIGTTGVWEHALPFGLTRTPAAGGALLICLVLTGVYGYCRRAWTGRQVDPLALLALVALVRCVSDPDPLAYNFVAAVIPLAAWEAGIRRRLPVASLSLCAILTFLMGGSGIFTILWLQAGLGESTGCLAWIALMLGLIGYVTRAAFSPPRSVAQPIAALARPAVP